MMVIGKGGRDVMMLFDNDGSTGRSELRCRLRSLLHRLDDGVADAGIAQSDQLVYTRSAGNAIGAHVRRDDVVAQTSLRHRDDVVDGCCARESSSQTFFDDGFRASNFMIDRVADGCTGERSSGCAEQCACRRVAIVVADGGAGERSRDGAQSGPALRVRRRIAACQ